MAIETTDPRAELPPPIRRIAPDAAPTVAVTTVGRGHQPSTTTARTSTSMKTTSLSAECSSESSIES